MATCNAKMIINNIPKLILTAHMQKHGPLPQFTSPMNYWIHPCAFMTEMKSAYFVDIIMIVTNNVLQLFIGYEFMIN